MPAEWVQITIDSGGIISYLESVISSKQTQSYKLEETLGVLGTVRIGWHALKDLPHVDEMDA